MDFNVTRMVFLSVAAATAAIGMLINVLEKHLPVYITQSYRYGKYGIAGSSVVSKLEFPKSWFKHFYVFAGPASSLVLALAVSKYVYDCDVPNFVYSILDLLFGSHRRALVSPESTLLATTLLTIQCWKRLYETHFVSIFSNGTINLTHYVIGFVHYIGSISCMIGESEGFVTGSNTVLRWNRLTNMQWICAIIFLCASFEQLKTNYILANLRKNKKGEVVTKSHKIPHGRLFEYISSPLQFTEIVMYLMLSMILWKSSTYHCVCFWVIANQAETATLTHSWYLKTFKDYPKQRKIFIPYLL